MDKPNVLIYKLDSMQGVYPIPFPQVTLPKYPNLIVVSRVLQEPAGELECVIYWPDPREIWGKVYGKPEQIAQRVVDKIASFEFVSGKNQPVWVAISKFF